MSIEKFGINEREIKEKELKKLLFKLFMIILSHLSGIQESQRITLKKNRGKFLKPPTKNSDKIFGVF